MSSISVVAGVSLSSLLLGSPLLLSGLGLLLLESGTLLLGSAMLLSAFCETTGRFAPVPPDSEQLAIESTSTAERIIAANFFIVVCPFRRTFVVYTNGQHINYGGVFHKCLRRNLCRMHKIVYFSFVQKPHIFMNKSILFMHNLFS